MKTTRAIARQLFGAKYESIRKSLLAACILFFALYAAGWELEIAPSILYLTTFCFSADVMRQLLTGRRCGERMEGLFVLPFENRGLVYSYAAVLGAHTLLTKTLLLWAAFFSAAAWSFLEIVTAFLCGCAACGVTAVSYLMCRKRKFALPLCWGAGILIVILFVPSSAAVLAAALASLAAAAVCLYFASAWDFYSFAAAKRTVHRKGRTGNVFLYLARYLTANKSYLVNTAGLWGIAVFLPLLFGGVQGLDLLPFGFVILCLNTPLCTLLSGDPDLEQALRVLPGQPGRFCRQYGLFLFAVNGFAAAVYLCSWQLIRGGIGLGDVGIAALFALLGAVLSVLLEWKIPIREWKTESDLWRHPRKYLVPLLLLLLAAFIGMWR